MIREDIPAAVAADANGVFIPKRRADEANHIFTEFLSYVTKDCVESGAVMIGHIKANVRSGDEMLSISSTTGDGNVRARLSFLSDVGEFDMTLNVIVYGIGERTISGIIADRGRMLGIYDMCAVPHGCPDPECSDPECADHARIIRPE
jgi:hypothetical protein